MATIKVDIREFGNVWRRSSPKIREKIQNGLVSGVLKGQRIVMGNSPVDTGLYQTSWATKVIALGRVHLGNSAPHAPIIEFGARPHKPPIYPLLFWAKRQLKSSGQPPNFSPEVWKLAVGVQKKIEREGQKPKHVLTKAIPQIVKIIKKEIEKELDGNL